MADDSCNGKENPTDIPDNLRLSTFHEGLVLFFPLLQKGFKLPALVPCTIWEFLRDQIGLSEEYISERISTIFIDGRATDNLGTAIIRNGSTMALSAAMPGVAGATFRRGSYYAAMRKDITAPDSSDAGGSADGEICIKLFNLMLTDLGAAFLGRGITVVSDDLIELFKCMPDSSLCGFREVLINNRKRDMGSLRHLDNLLTTDTVLLSVNEGLEPSSE